MLYNTRVLGKCFGTTHEIWKIIFCTRCRSLFSQPGSLSLTPGQVVCSSGRRVLVHQLLHDFTRFVHLIQGVTGHKSIVQGVLKECNKYSPLPENGLLLELVKERLPPSQFVVVPKSSLKETADWGVVRQHQACSCQIEKLVNIG